MRDVQVSSKLCISTRESLTNAPPQTLKIRTWKLIRTIWEYFHVYWTTDYVTYFIRSIKKYNLWPFTQIKLPYTWMEAIPTSPFFSQYTKFKKSEKLVLNMEFSENISSKQNDYSNPLSIYPCLRVFTFWEIVMIGDIIWGILFYTQGRQPCK